MKAAGRLHPRDNTDTRHAGQVCAKLDKIKKYHLTVRSRVKARRDRGLERQEGMAFREPDGYCKLSAPHPIKHTDDFMTVNKIYSNEQLLNGINVAIAGGRQSDSDKLDERLLALIKTIELEAYNQGKREIQAMMRKALNIGEQS